MRNPIIQSNSYNSLPVITPDTGCYSYYQNYLSITQRVMNDMLSRHSKVLVYRIDLRFPEGYNGYRYNEIYSTFMNNVSIYVRSGLHYDFMYITRLEQKNSDVPHLHVALLFDGNRFWLTDDFKEKIERYWEMALNVYWPGVNGGLVESDGFKIITRLPGNEAPLTSSINYEDTFKMLSYLSKHIEEDIVPSSTRKFFASIKRTRK